MTNHCKNCTLTSSNLQQIVDLPIKMKDQHLHRIVHEFVSVFIDFHCPLFATIVCNSMFRPKHIVGWVPGLDI